MNGILAYIVFNQKMTDDGILEKIPVSNLIENHGKSSPSDIHYTIKKLYDDGYITVEHNDKDIIEYIVDVTKKGHNYFQTIDPDTI